MKWLGKLTLVLIVIIAEIFPVCLSVLSQPFRRLQGLAFQEKTVILTSSQL